MNSHHSDSDDIGEANISLQEACFPDDEDRLSDDDDYW